MIPVQLTLKGFYSYQKSETIAFEPLIEARLFGIFGPVGSGKSAILEAIMFVLFDRSTRLNKAGDDRYYNMMNLQSNETIIDFIFKAGPNHKNKYRFYFKSRRKARDFQKVEVKDRSYYQWQKNEWTPLPHGEVLDISYENFMQTVIVPQGKFREFIDHKPTARTQMLKELFHLERFDIAPRANYLLASVRDELTFLEGQLSQYQQVDKKQLQQWKEEIKELTKLVGVQSKQVQSLERQLAEMLKLKQLSIDLNDTSEVLATLRKEEDFYQQKENQLNRYEKAFNLFRQKIQQQCQILQDLKKKEEDLRKVHVDIEQVDSQLEEAKKAWRRAKIHLEKKDLWRQHIDELGALLEMKVLNTQIIDLDRNFQDAKREVDSLRQREKKLNEVISQTQSSLTSVEGAAHTLQNIQAQEKWWDLLEEKKNKQQEQIREIENIQEEILQTQKSLKKERALAKTGTAVRRELEKLRHQLQELVLHQDWVEHAQRLEEGMPCPLCGSTHHPKTLTPGSLDQSLQKTRGRMEALEQQLETVREAQNRAAVWQNTLQLKSQQKKELMRQSSRLAKEIGDYKKSYPGSDASDQKPQHLADKIKALQVKAREESKLQVELKQLSKQLDQVNRQLIPRRESFQAIAFEKEKRAGEMAQSRRQIRSLKPNLYLKKSKSELEDEARQLMKKLQQADAEYQTGLVLVQQNEQSLSHQKGLRDSLIEQVKELEERSQKLDRELMALCQKEGFKNPREVQNILAYQLDIPKEREQILAYRESIKLHKNNLLHLQKQIGEKKYDELQHSDLQDELESVKEQLEQNRHQLSGKQFSYKEQLEHLKKKEQIQQEVDSRTIRKDQIQEVANLLRGNGFINYISSVYLQNLCSLANQRFLRLTGNRLSLELNQQNDFMVRDYLNDGRLRLLKTLSGGQIFQASLCLALALAEHVTTLNRSDQSFFFLDEGFGTLDKASLQVVFETLKSLQKENRIVGIISHVEELQQEIDIYLAVDQPGQSGSRIKRSWEVEVP